MRAGGPSGRCRSRLSSTKRSPTSSDAERGDPQRQVRSLRKLRADDAARRASGSASRVSTGDARPATSALAAEDRVHATCSGGMHREHRQRGAAVVAVVRDRQRAAGKAQRERARGALGGEHPCGRGARAASRRRACAAASTSRARAGRRRRRRRIPSCTSPRRARPPSTRRAAADRRAGSRAVPRTRIRRLARARCRSWPCAPRGNGGAPGSGSGYTTPASGKCTYDHARHRPSGCVDDSVTRPSARRPRTGAGARA